MKKVIIVFLLNLMGFLAIFLPLRFLILPLFLSSKWQISLLSLLLTIFLSPKFSLFTKSTPHQLFLKIPFIKRAYLFNLFK